MSYSSKIVPRGLQGFYLEALRSLAVCKLCMSVLHSSRASQSGGFKHDLAFQMICRSAGASQGSGRAQACFLTVALNRFPCVGCSVHSPPGFWVDVWDALSVGGKLPKCLHSIREFWDFFQTKVFITLKNTIHSAWPFTFSLIHLLTNSLNDIHWAPTIYQSIF